MSLLRLGPPSEVICLGAHADDLEIGAGGLLLTLAADHPETTFRFVILTGSTERKGEAEASATRLLGDRVALTWGGMRDGMLPYREPAAAKQFVAESGPADESALVVAPRVDDAHQDHRFLSQLAWQVFRGATILEYEIPKWEAESFAPNLYFPLASSIAQTKLAHLESSFPSQHDKPWYRRAVFEARMTLRGVECRSESGFAEAFVVRKLVMR